MTLFATQVKRRRGTTAENDAFTGAEGEITVDLTTHELRVHDGSTVGGHILYTKSDVDTALAGKTNTDLSNLTSAGKEVCANMSMPSGRYINLTLGSSGAGYTAPADGYFSLASTFDTNGLLYLYRGSGARYGLSFLYNANIWVDSFIPVAKGDVIIIQYNGTASVHSFRFIYANGAQ